MRNVESKQMKLGELGIEKIRLNERSRDDVVKALYGLQQLYSDEEGRARVFALLDGGMLPGVRRDVGRPGMTLWQILVLGVLQKSLNCDFARLENYANSNREVRQMLGGIDVGFDDAMHFSEQAITDNLNLLPPELLCEAYSLVAEYGQGFAKKKSAAAGREACSAVWSRALAATGWTAARIRSRSVPT